MDPLPKLGRYQLEARLGEGAFAEVYKARDTLLKRAVALKLLKPALLADQDAFARFIQEAQVAAELTHPRIAWVHDLGEADGRYFIVMRYIEGPSLDRLIQEQGSLSWGDASRILEQVGEALSYAHARGLVHRDIKPQNILLHPQEGAVLTDFGLVRAMENSRMTRSGTMIGTPQYMAPELWKGQPATPAADQYALACLLVEMLSGKVLFDGPTPPAVMFQHFQAVEFSGGWIERIPTGVDVTLLRAMAKEPEQRFPDVDVFLKALQGAEVKVRLKSERNAAEIKAQREEQERNATEAKIQQEKAERKAAEDKLWEELLTEEARLKEEAERKKAEVRQQERESRVVIVAALRKMVDVKQKEEEYKRRKAQEKAAKVHTQGDRMFIKLADHVNMEFCRIPAGEFLMGSDPKVDKRATSDERPQQNIFLDEYWMGRYPVTNREYKIFTQTTGHSLPRHWKGENIPLELDTHPVVRVSWQDAVDFCSWLSQISGEFIHLPSEAEWEKAARGADGRIYPWGNEKPTVLLCNFDSNVGTTTPVGTYSPRGDSPFNCADMAGNVWEWCEDIYEATHYAIHQNRNPKGPQSGAGRVLRGGSYYYASSNIRAADRYWYDQDYRDNNIGFRCALSVRST